MKILFVESRLTGHRIVYHRTLINSVGCNKSLLITPSYSQVECQQLIDDSINLCPRKLKDYIRWIKYVKKIADYNNVDTIHFLDGDLLYRFWGLYLDSFCRYKTIVTFHHISKDIIHYLSVSSIISKVTYGVVHTEKLKQRFIHFDNIKLIDYPYFPNKGEVTTKEISRKYYGINKESIVLLALGGTRFDKGLDILLDALKNIDNNQVVLLVAGKEEFFKKDFIEKHNTGTVKLKTYLKPLSDTEWNMALLASDYVILPYRKLFSGASGPLTEAVWFKKPIIGKDNSSIGDMIKKYELGWTFKTEDSDDLANVINGVISKHEEYVFKSFLFRNRISIDSFLNRYMKLYKTKKLIIH